MQRAHLSFVYLVCSLGFALAVETIRPDPAAGELLVNDFTLPQSTSNNAMGHPVFTEAGMQMTFSDDDDPRVILSPTNRSSFFYSFVRQVEQCFDASNFDYISLELKAEADLNIVVGFSTNPNNCDETAQSAMRYSLRLIKCMATEQKRSVADIPISAIPGDALKTNINTLMIGGLTKPIEIYSVKLKSARSQTVNESTILLDERQAVSISENSSDDVYPVPDDSATESGEVSNPLTLVVEDFTTDDLNENALGGTHGTDGTMSQETYTAGQGVFLTSSGASSYWYTVIPCTNAVTFKHYDMLLLDVVGPKGGDFSIRLKTQVQCESDFKEFVFKASSLLKVKLDGTLQHAVIPFDVMEGFDKRIHTIASVIIGDFRNEEELHDNATPMSLNVKSVLISGKNGNDSDDDDKNQERIPAKEKVENPTEDDNIEERLDSSYNGAPRSAISIVAIAPIALMLLL